jgi:hypothetical protein
MRNIVVASLVLLLATQAAALSKHKLGVSYCNCVCTAGKLVRAIEWEKDKPCTSSNGENCKLATSSGPVSGTLSVCKECKGLADGTCSFGPAAITTPTPPQGTLTPTSPAGTTVPPRVNIPGTVAPLTR